MYALIVYIIILLLTYLIYKYFFQTTTKDVVHEGVCCKIAVTTQQCINLVNELKSLKPKVIGFDIEWSSKRNETKKVSLIQLGCKDLIVLLRMNLIETIPSVLHSFLGNPEILKAGIGIHADKSKVNNDYKLDVHGCIDLNDIFNHLLPIDKQNKLKSIYYKKHINNFTTNEQNNSFGLKTMSLMLLKHKMKYKQTPSFHFHDKWNDNLLSQHHIHYACDDALIGYKLFIKLMENINIKKQNNHQINQYLEICFGLIDKKTSSKPQKHKIKPQKSNNINNKNVKKNSKNKIDLNEIKTCVVCGVQYKMLQLTKYIIVPTKYYRYMNIMEVNLKARYNAILTCKPCHKLCILNENNFGAFLCNKYQVKPLNNRRTFIKIRTAVNGLIDANIRYKLPIKVQIQMLKDICSYYNLSYDIIYNKNDEKDNENEEKELEEYKWQWYNNETTKGFVDNEENISNEIENKYISGAKTMQFERQTRKKLNVYDVSFDTMEQQNIKSKYKRGMRRIYKNDRNELKQFGLHTFDHLINITYNGCCIPITTNIIINECIQDIMINEKKSVNKLQREEADIHSKKLFHVIKDPQEFIKLWQD
eukprot:255328_1